MPSDNSDTLKHACQIQCDAAELGFDWPDIHGPLSKVREEVDEIEEALDTDDLTQAQKELGDLLFAAVNVARFLKVDPAKALDDTNLRFEKRFAFVRDAFAQQGREMKACSLQELDAVWERAKKCVG